MPNGKIDTQRRRKPRVTPGQRSHSSAKPFFGHLINSEMSESEIIDIWIGCFMYPDAYCEEFNLMPISPSLWTTLREIADALEFEVELERKESSGSVGSRTTRPRRRLISRDGT